MIVQSTRLITRQGANQPYDMVMDVTPSNTESSTQSLRAESRHIRRRNRIPLSCGLCRQRKLKCDRASPTCDQCSKRGVAGSCSYSAPSARRTRKQPRKASKAEPRRAGQITQDRIDRIENLLLTLVEERKQSIAEHSPTASIESENTSGSVPTSCGDDDCTFQEGSGARIGIMRVEPDTMRPFYNGETHWAAVLDSISEVKAHLQTHQEQFNRQGAKIAQSGQHLMHYPGPDLLFGALRPSCREEIMSQIPSRYTCDILMSRYFETAEPALHIIHHPTFQKQYNEHWESPSQTSIVWIAMLFAMMRLAVRSWHGDKDAPPEYKGKCTDLASLYRSQVSQALILADYTKPHAYLIETFIFHLYGEYVSSTDAQNRIWVLVATIARLAMGMGFHRDPKWFPNISPFQGEMRRRVWAFIRQSDILFSFQSALPTLIRIGDSDTNLPHNLLDTDFDEDTLVLPTSRPGSSFTPISFTIAKTGLVFGLGRVLEEVNSSRTRKLYSEILEIDRHLRELYENLPVHLRLRSAADRAVEPIPQTMGRYTLATLHHKSICALHRQYLQEMPSRKACLNSAMAILSFQSMQHEDPRLEDHQTSLTTTDFLYAATLICKDLCNHYHAKEPQNGRDKTSYGECGIPKREVVLESLRRSRSIWYEKRDKSIDAYKASEVVGMLLAKLDRNMTGDWEPDKPAMETRRSKPNAHVRPSVSKGAESDEFSQTQQVTAQTASSGTTDGSSVHEEKDIGYQGRVAKQLVDEGDTTALFDMTDGGGLNFDWVSAYMHPPRLDDPVANLWTMSSNDKNEVTSGDTWLPTSNLSGGGPFYNSRDIQNTGLDSRMSVEGIRNETAETLATGNDLGNETGEDDTILSWKWDEVNDLAQGQSWAF